MKKLSKKNYILLAISLVIITCYIGIYNYRKPITFHKTVNATIRPYPTDDNFHDVVLRKTTVEINAKIYKKLYDVRNDKIYYKGKIKGKIIIDNKEYTFTGSSPGNSNCSQFLCFLNKNDTYNGFIIQDLSFVEIYCNY